VDDRDQHRPAAGLMDRRRKTVPRCMVVRLILYVLRLIQGSLRAKLLLAIVALEVALMGTVAIVMESQQRAALAEHTGSRAGALGARLAALSPDNLTSENSIALQQEAEQATANEPAVLLQQTRQKLLGLTLAALVCGALLAVWLARHMIRPLRQLMAAAQHLAEGSYDCPMQVGTRDEIGDLALAFEHMRRSLQRHLTSLADEKDLLQEANRRIQRTQQQLMKTERLVAVGKLAAGVAHEINNPLAIIRTSIRVLRNQSRDNDPAMETLEVIEEEICRASRIIRELLGFARPNSSRDVVALNAVVCSLEGMLKENLHAQKIVLRIILEPGLPQVQISADHLKQVILNLVRNAEDAMPAGGELIIQTAGKQDAVELSVADTGCGISAEHLGHLFDPFFSTKAPGKGTGLGLSVSYGLIDSANGHIDVESEVGKGTTFRVRLPVYEPSL